MRGRSGVLRPKVWREDDGNGEEGGEQFAAESHNGASRDKCEGNIIGTFSRNWTDSMVKSVKVVR
jgi:hypothetical protein